MDRTPLFENVFQYAEYEYFDLPDENRDFQFLVEEKSLWIISKDLSFHSPVFEKMMNDTSFNEARQKKAILVDKTFGDIHEFFACLFHCPDRKPISFANFSRNMELADEYDVKEITFACVLFLKQKIESNEIYCVYPPLLHAHKIFETCFKFPKLEPFQRSLYLLISSLSFSLERDPLAELIPKPLFNMICSTQKSVGSASHKHNFDEPDDTLQCDGMNRYHVQCGRKINIKNCSICHQNICDVHRKSTECILQCCRKFREVHKSTCFGLMCRFDKFGY